MTVNGSEGTCWTHADDERLPPTIKGLMLEPHGMRGRLDPTQPDALEEFGQMALAVPGR